MQSKTKLLFKNITIEIALTAVIAYIIFLIIENVSSDKINELLLIISCLFYIASGIKATAWDFDLLRVFSFACLIVSGCTIYGVGSYLAAYYITISLILSSYIIKIQSAGGVKKYFAI